MIRLINVSKSFGNKIVLNNFNFEFPRKGLYIIHGPSGCGKSTLLNCLSGLLNCDGKIVIDGIEFNSMSEDDKSDYRLRNMGLIFQDFKLFENDNVFNNVLLPLDTSNNMDDILKKRKVNDLLLLVGMYEKSKQLTCLLSGGEKQRVCIARSLVNDPSVVLADEPTGSLDESNSEEIMSLLKTISRTKLVIVVSHDEDLCRKYADIIIRLDEGNITFYEKFSSLNNEHSNLNVIKNKNVSKKSSIPFKFLLKHTYLVTKQRKWRTIFSTFIMSLSLVTVGMASAISKSVSSSIKDMCNSFIDSGQIIVTPKKPLDISSQINACEEEIVESIRDDYSKYIYDYGIVYKADFNTFFKDEQTFTIVSGNNKIDAQYFSFNAINEYSWLDISRDKNFYPSIPNTLEDDEIVVSFNMTQVSSLCFSLHIIRTVESLSEFIKTNGLYLVVTTKNDSWQYDDQHMFKIKAFTMDVTNNFYHINHKWNEHIFENEMKLLSSQYWSNADHYPWTMKKAYYLSLNNKEEFYKKFLFDQKYQSICIELGSNNYFPFTVDEYTDDHLINKGIVFYSIGGLNPLIAKNMKSYNPDIRSVMYGSNAGYSFFSSAMLSGFSNYIYFSYNENILLETIEILSNSNINKNEQFILPDNILIGHYSKSLFEGVSFEVLSDNADMNIDDIYISKGMANKIGFDGKSNYLYISYLENETQLSNGAIKRNFKQTKLNILGTIDDEKNKIYASSEWLLMFFALKLSVSSFNLYVNSFSLDVDESNVETTIKKMSLRYPEYNFESPINNIMGSVYDVCKYVEIILLVFSIVTALISMLILSLCTSLYLIDSKKDILLSMSLGINKKESTKFLRIYTGIMCLFSFLISVFDLLVASFIIKIGSQDYLNINLTFSFGLSSFIYMALLGIFICVLSCLTNRQNVKRFTNARRCTE